MPQTARHQIPEKPPTPLPENVSEEERNQKFDFMQRSPELVMRREPTPISEEEDTRIKIARMSPSPKREEQVPIFEEPRVETPMKQIPKAVSIFIEDADDSQVIDSVAQKAVLIVSDEKEANKSLADAFKKKNLAKRLTENLPQKRKPEKKEKTKEELAELRKNMMKKKKTEAKEKESEPPKSHFEPKEED